MTLRSRSGRATVARTPDRTRYPTSGEIMETLRGERGDNGDHSFASSRIAQEIKDGGESRLQQALLIGGDRKGRRVWSLRSSAWHENEAQSYTVTYCVLHDCYIPFVFK